MPSGRHACHDVEKIGTFGLNDPESIHFGCQELTVYFHVDEKPFLSFLLLSDPGNKPLCPAKIIILTPS